MNHDRMLSILTALANGTDPVTGAVFPAGSPYQQSETVRALFHAVRALESDGSTAAACPTTASVETTNDTPTDTTLARKPGKSSRAAPQGGKPWTSDDDMLLGAGFDAGSTLADLAKSLGRSRLSIEIRLAKLGRLTMPANARYGTGRTIDSTPSASVSSSDSPDAETAFHAPPVPAAQNGTAVADATRIRYVLNSAPLAQGIDEEQLLPGGRSARPAHSAGETRFPDTEHDCSDAERLAGIAAHASTARQTFDGIRSSDARQWFEARQPARHPSAPAPADAIEALSRLVARTFSSRTTTP